jgi:hypothetical protein
MFLIRLLLRLALLFFLWVSLTLAWRSADGVTQLVLSMISVLLVAGIYAIRFLRNIESKPDASGNLPASEWQLMWSRQTPFFPPASSQGASYEVSPLTSGGRRMSPGFHIVCARLLPMSASALILWLLYAATNRNGEWLNPWLLQVSGLRQADLSMLFVVVGMISYMALYAVLQTQFIANVPARCVSQGCEGHAFLFSQADASKNWGRRRYQLVYICREHRHRNPTGVQCM